MPGRDLVTGVLQLANLLTRRLTPLFEKSGLTPQQWSVLVTIAHAGAPLSLAALARELLVSKQNMTGMIARLEQLGVVDRSGDPADLRSSRVYLTRRGRSVLEKIQPAYDEWLEQLHATLPPRDVAAAERTVERLIAELES